ncbi:hypothetical protein A5657_13920 [Mycobacterium kubicae]|nr:hypothetical protein A5657_13920 [Mycobacterium kubicae]
MPNLHDLHGPRICIIIFQFDGCRFFAICNDKVSLMIKFCPLMQYPVHQLLRSLQFLAAYFRLLCQMHTLRLRVEWVYPNAFMFILVLTQRCGDLRQNADNWVVRLFVAESHRIAECFGI